MSHLRFSGRPDSEQRQALDAIIRNDAVLMDALGRLRVLDLPQGLLVAGAIYNCVWNTLTRRPPLTGINDIDIVYFDPDLTYEAEDAVIKRADAAFADLPIPVQVRNQARVHLWFPEKFGQPLAPLTSADAMLPLYASKTHAVAARLRSDDSIEIIAPFGLDDIFSFRITPNAVLPMNRATHDKKGARARTVWPELGIIAWPDD